MKKKTLILEKLLREVVLINDIMNWKLDREATPSPAGSGPKADWKKLAG